MIERPLWERIQQIYYSTLSVAEPERHTFIDTLCDSDPVLVKEVTSLLEAEKESGDFLEPPIFEKGLRLIAGTRFKHFADSPPDKLIGTTIDGRYLIERELGRGGMGAVYLARDLSLHNRPVVIKTLLPAMTLNPTVVRRFRQEVEALCRIDHPGVVNVLDAGELPNGQLFIAMQYINGVTLRSQISTDGMDLERAASIVTQVGAALDAIHEKGIFHRDLKPENIMLQTHTSGTEFVKIVDFGIAKVKESVVAPSTIDEAPIGTVVYMSPEQLRGDRITVVSDVFSMALVAYEMLTGRRPFNPNSAAHLLELQRAGVRVTPADLRPAVSAEAQAIILGALSFEPRHRYQHAGSFGDTLASALIGEPTLTQIKQSKRTQWPLIIAASLLLVAGIAALTAFYVYRANQQATAAVSKQRSFSYWFTVQKVRDGKNYQDPFQSSGDEIFENGHKFRINVSSPDPGYLYILNEGPPEADGSTLTMLYPTRARENAFVSNLAAQTNWNRFRGQPGTENIWIIWSTSLVSELETAKIQAFEDEKGELTNNNSIRAVREFLTKHAEPKPKSVKDTTAKMTHISGAGEVVIKLAQPVHK